MSRSDGVVLRGEAEQRVPAGFRNEETLARIITIASGKGGTGKTTTAAALASSIAALGYKTLCIDFDVGLGNLDMILGMSDYAIVDFSDVIRGRQKLMHACRECPRIKNLFFLAAPVNLSESEPDKIAVLRMFREISDEFDYCIIDSPAGIGQGFRLAHICSEMSIIVTFAELPALKNAGRAVDVARTMNINEIRLLINRADKKKYIRMQTNIDDAIDTVGARLIGIIREDPSVSYAVHEATPLILYKKRQSVYDYLDTARRILGEDLPLKLR